MKTTALILSTLLSASAFADDHMPRGKVYPGPLEYVEACKVQQCSTNHTMPIIAWTERVRKVAGYTLMTAKMHHERQNKAVQNWRVAGVGEVGNCVTCAMTQREQLRALYPAHKAAFRLGIIDTNGDKPFTHMILTIETTKGTYVCDCNSSVCVKWDRVGEWLQRETVTGEWEVLNVE